MRNFYNAIQAFSPLRGEGEGDKSFTQSELDAAVAAAVAKANDESSAKFNTAKSELLSDLKKTKEAAKKFEGLDVDNIRTMMNAFENDQDLKDIAEGKHKEVIDRRIEKERAEFKSQIENLSDKTNEYEKENDSLKTRVSKLMIDNNVVSEFVKEKGLESGIQDVVLRANQIFKVEGEDLIPRNEKGDIITGKNGAMTISEWVTNLKEGAPHLFPSSTGSGTPGGTGGSGGSKVSEQIANAAKAGDMKEYRRLRKLQAEGKV